MTVSSSHDSSHHSFVQPRALLSSTLAPRLAKIFCIALVLPMVRRTAGPAALQPGALRAVVTQLRARLSLARVSVARVDVCARGADERVRGARCRAGLCVAGGDCVGGLAGRLGDGVGGEGLGGRGAAGGEDLCVELGGGVLFGDLLADLVLGWMLERGDW